MLHIIVAHRMGNNVFPYLLKEPCEKLQEALKFSETFKAYSILIIPEPLSVLKRVIII